MRGFGIVQIAPEVDLAPRDLDQLALTHQGQHDHTQRQADRRTGRDRLPLMERQPDLGRRQRPIFRHKGRDRDAPAPRSRRDDPRCAERAQDVTGATAPAPLRPVGRGGGFCSQGPVAMGELAGAWASLRMVLRSTPRLQALSCCETPRSKGARTACFCCAFKTSTSVSPPPIIGQGAMMCCRDAYAYGCGFVTVTLSRWGIFRWPSGGNRGGG